MIRYIYICVSMRCDYDIYRVLFKFQPVKPTAVRPLLNSQASIPTTGSTATIKSNLLSSSTPSKTIPMTPSHSSPSSTSNHIATTNAGNFATVAASHTNSQAIHSTSSKTSCKYLS